MNDPSKEWKEGYNTGFAAGKEAAKAEADQCKQVIGSMVLWLNEHGFKWVVAQLQEKVAGDLEVQDIEQRTAPAPAPGHEEPEATGPVPNEKVPIPKEKGKGDIKHGQFKETRAKRTK